MNSLMINSTLKTFASDVAEGLTASPKFLNSQYFYDKNGDEIFQEIMKLPGYYLTACEYEILDHYKQKILDLIQAEENQMFDLIEFGAGDGFKTKVLLRHFLGHGANFKYIPVDISKNVLISLESELEGEFPSLTCEPLAGEYFQALRELNKHDTNKKVILFLGSNIGNFSSADTHNFLRQLSGLMTTGDKVIIGFDLKKDPVIIRQAYDDPQGVTKAFNLNLLARINRELGANFDLTSFKHVATYNPENGEAKSYLMSTRKQSVELKKIGELVHFDQWETIFTEVSQKYDLISITGFAESNGFRVVENLFDCKHFYVDSVWEKR